MASPYEPPTESLRGEVPSAGSRIAAILAHLSAPIAALLSAGSLSLLGPLLVWLVMKRDPMARRAAAGAFNFNLAFWLLYLVSWLLIFTVIGAVIGIPLIAVMLWLMESAGALWWLWAWGVWMAFMLVMTWAYPTVIAPLFNKFEPLQDEPPERRDMSSTAR